MGNHNWFWLWLRLGNNWRSERNLGWCVVVVKVIVVVKVVVVGVGCGCEFHSKWTFRHSRVLFCVVHGLVGLKSVDGCSDRRG